MKPLNIDFVERPLWRLPVASRQRQILAAIAITTALAAAAVFWQWQQLDRQLAEATRAIAQAHQEIVARTPPAPVPIHLSEPQIVARVKTHFGDW